MLKNRALLLALLAALCLRVPAIAVAREDNNLVYAIQFASVLSLGQEGASLTVPFESSLSGVNRQELAKQENWALEVDGSVIPNEPLGVRVEALPSPRFIRLTLGSEINLTGHQARLIFKGTTPNIILANLAAASFIEVLFAGDAPADTAIEDTANWMIRTLDLQSGAEEQFHPDSVTVAHPPNLKAIPTLRINRHLDPAMQRIVVRLQLPNFSEFTIGEPKKTGASKAFTAAKGKDDADIYFSGTAVGARGSKPLYSFESKLGYLFSLRRWGAFGPRAEVNAASESNIDPDSILVTAAYEKVFVFGPAHGLILRSDAFGLEFDKENRNRNLTTELNGTLVFPPAHLGESTFAALDLMAGFEAGHNFRHKLDANGLGGFWRWKFGANVYFVALHPPGFKRIDFSAGYKVRLLRSAEPFTETINGMEMTSLRKKPRHHVSSDLDFMFSDVFGVTLKYRYGSLPPDYKFVNHTVSAGITFKLKQANK